MAIDFKGQVAIVTGAGNGLGKSHALELAARGAKVVVNDLGGSRDGSGASSEAAKDVVKIICERGGEAISNGANVSNYSQVDAMVKSAVQQWRTVDILINNAGILRDRSFAKMTLDDFRLVMEVHLMGTVNCCKAVWELMSIQNYGRIVVTSSSSGMYGNFGQSNYGAAKMAVLGLMNTLGIEGEKKNIHVNALSPAAATRMTEGLLPSEVVNLMTPESVSAAALALCHKNAPNRQILCAGAGSYAASQMIETKGVHLTLEQQSVEGVVAAWSEITSDFGQGNLTSGAKQSEKFIAKAMQA